MEEVRATPRVSGEALAALRRLKNWRAHHWLLFSIPIMLSLALVWLHITSPPPNLSVETYERIREGMTQTEVERIIGARPGGYGLYCAPGQILKEEWRDAVRSVRWSDASGYLSVGFDADGRVCQKVYQYHESTRISRQRGSWWEELRRRSIPGEPSIVYISF